MTKVPFSPRIYGGADNVIFLGANNENNRCANTTF